MKRQASQERPAGAPKSEPEPNSPKRPQGASQSEPPGKRPKASPRASVPKRPQVASQSEPSGSRPKTVLFVTYYYPPSGGPGVQRSLKFTRYLSEYDWEPVVVTVRPDYAAYPAWDESLLMEVPTDLPVRRTRSWDPYAMYARLTGKTKDDTVGVGFIGESDPGWKERLGRWLRANLFLPDARVGWVPYAIAECRRVLREREVDVVFTTGPPHSTHLVGYWAARRRGLPWVADLRDPWTDIDYYSLLPSTQWARKVESLIERTVLSTADVVTVVGPGMDEALSARLKRKYDVIYNGFDPADFAASTPGVDRERFVISHVGSMTASANPAAFWEALASLQVITSMPELRVQLVGKVDPVVRSDVVRHGLDSIVEMVPYLSHAEAIDRMKTSALLLLSIGRMPGAEGILTGKVFEYIASRRPILAIGPTEGDAAGVVRRASAGDTYCHNCATEVAKNIRRHYVHWKQGMPLDGSRPERAAEFSRLRQAEQLADCLDEAVTARSLRSLR